MPELPDIAAYIEALRPRILGQTLEDVRIADPFVLHSVEPPAEALRGRPVSGLRRLGKRIVIALDQDQFIVIHLMVAGRLLWRERGARIPGRVGLAAFDFPTGTLLLTEASKKKRASIRFVHDPENVRALDPGGVEVLEVDGETFRHALLRENHTLKRALTDPRLFSGIGNAYSDEILHRARLSPVKLTRQMTEEEVAGLFIAAKEVLKEWTARLIIETGADFPEKVTAFRPEMAVHGRLGQPCAVCGTNVQRIAYAESETNYCPRCQTGGRLLADRALSRLLKEDWPATIDQLEQAAFRMPSRLTGTGTSRSKPQSRRRQLRRKPAASGNQPEQGDSPLAGS